jgi:hypothetical protein
LCDSEVFGDGNRRVLVDGKEVKALCLFRKNITPEWEDPSNREGAEFYAVKVLSPEALDFHWENVVFGLIGEAVDDEGDNICGARIVHQGKKMKGGFKLEIWLKRNDQEMTNRLKVKLAEILSDNNDKIKQAYRLTATDFSNFVTHSN